MAQVAVAINGRSYSVACGDGEEQRIEQLASYVDGKITSLKGALGNLGDQRLMVLASLVIADELWEARDGGPKSKHEQTGGLRASTIENLAGRIETLAAQLENT
jgi:cell division protein ZapA